ELGAGDPRPRAELLHAPGGRPHVVVVLKDLVDQGLQGLIAEDLPPGSIGQGGGVRGLPGGFRGAKPVRDRDGWPLVVRPHGAASYEKTYREKPSSFHESTFILRRAATRR